MPDTGFILTRCQMLPDFFSSWMLLVHAISNLAMSTSAVDHTSCTRATRLLDVYMRRVWQWEADADAVWCDAYALKA